MQDKYFIDSNIFLYSFSDQDNKKQLIAKNIVSSDAVISVQVINEVSKNLIYKFGFDEDDLSKFVHSAYAKYYISNLTETIFVEASSIRKRYSFSYYDSVIVSAALNSNCHILYSEDMQHNQVIDGRLEIIDPFVGLLSAN